MIPPVYFAPLQSYTTLAYYRAFSELFIGVQKYFTPFYRKNKNNVFEYETFLKLTPKINIIPQVLTNSADDLLGFAIDMQKRGFEEINLNLGCPFPMVANRRLGSGLLPFANEVEQLLSHYYSKDLKVRLSIKTRLGWVSDNELNELISVFNQFPIEELIIHPRLGIQKYKGVPNWDAFEMIKQKANLPVIGNGDIFSVTQLEGFKSRFSDTKGWMIGRGLLTKPFLFHEDLSGTDRREFLMKFHDLFMQELQQQGYRENQILNQLKVFWEYPSTNFKGGFRLFRKIRKTGKMEEYTELKNRLLDLDIE